jgi:hypothetical protein
MKTKKGVRLINCARGGLVDELAVRDLLASGHIAGAGFDVFTEEPAKANVLFGAPNLVCTPHLGAATVEAQENVALQVAEQMSDYLLTGAIQNSLNMPNVTAEEAPRLAPYLDLAEKLGSFAGQLTETDIKAVAIEYEGQVAALNVKPLTQMALTGVLRPAARHGQHGERAGDRPRARHRGRRGQARARHRLHLDDPAVGHRPTSRPARSPARCSAASIRASSRSRASRSRPSSRRTCSTSPTTTSRASSAGSAPCSARTRSTSRPSISAATSPAARRSRWCRSTSRCRPS